MGQEKLSSRQKMIGVMYLVLTAMLALQVSSSVLDKFMVLSHSIDTSRKLQFSQNERAIQSLKNMGKDMGNRREDIKILTQVLAMHQDTVALVDYIDGLKKQLIDAEGGIDRLTKLPKGLKSDTAVARFMINKGEGGILKTKLNGYIAQLSNLVHKPYTPIAFDAKNHDFFSHDPNQAKKDFVTLNFDHTPLGAALATLSQFASEVVTTEADAINTLGNIIGSSDVKFDTLKLLANTKSYIVTAGSKYEADLILAASSSAVTPEMFIDGQPIRVQDGVGKVSFTTSPGSYDSHGFAKKTFKAAIKLRLPGGKESIITEDIPYQVAKPVIQVKAAAVQSLYRNCGNELDIQVPSLGAAYNPRFKVEGGIIIPGPKKGVVTVMPKANEVKLKVYNEDNLIDTVSFIVQNIPTPQISITTKNKPIDMKLGIPAPGPRVVEAKVIPNKYFQDFLPKDARYQVVEWVITLARGSRPVHTLKVNQSIADLHSIASLAKPGDRLVVEIKKIERKNFKNEVETIMDRSCFNILLN
ncbi:gliding motility protein GldM [Cardinium endosymbiont of Oedothorax gibbosus]|uniref:type IX secretion system motor protein PorM/GldM n=1 Tax=Cardinium endosymbiont of Oedothorax gibbosus TaxID=931101 RepID=UPI002024E9EC|nr:gliding motility protein GldM [Cardinium endosymbiont of Oedothorax gibbosus]CAH2559700.1 Gliding motility-associated protein GldM [Cardinium endosymbiont of Oedothorax gibbosus]